MKIIVHSNEDPKKNSKKIEVYKCFDAHFDVCPVDIYDYETLHFDQIELVCRNYPSFISPEKGYDLIFACHSYDRSRNLLYLGYWNDGVV